MNKMPTPKQKEVLDMIMFSVLMHGYSPTLEEMSKELGISRVSVWDRISALKKKGLVRNHPYAARSYVVVKKPESPKSVGSGWQYVL